MTYAFMYQDLIWAMYICIQLVAMTTFGNRRTNFLAECMGSISQRCRMYIDLEIRYHSAFSPCTEHVSMTVTQRV